MRVLPLLMSSDSDKLIKEEILNNHFLQVNSQKARRTFMNEFIRRYKAVPYSFWKMFQNLDETAQRAGLFYAILKAYRLVFDFHFDVSVRRWNGIDQSVSFNDLMMELGELSAKDAFVNSWTDSTKRRCASQYLTILRQCGMLDDKSGTLRPLSLDVSYYEYYIRVDEEWFLEACFLYPYEIAKIKSQLK